MLIGIPDPAVYRSAYRMKHIVPIMLCSAALAVAAPFAHAQTKPAAAPLAAPKIDWAFMAKLPDWSGVWIPDRTDQDKQLTGNVPPWTAEVAKQVDQDLADERAGKPHNLFLDCLPEAMPTWMMISHNAMEILVTPGRVTMLGESDANRLRRIYTDGRKHPADPDPSFHGHSIGTWQGQTLVVDTVAILPQTWIAIKEAAGIPNNGDMHIVERIYLSAPDVLADELTITAPHVLTAPYKTTRYFKRQRGEKADILEGICLQGSVVEAKDKFGNDIFVAAKHE